MCGIAGVILRSGRPDASQLFRAAELLKHRGPDERGVEIVDSVGLAHTRLSIIDLEGGHQPIVDPKTKNVLVANGEIYNFIELRQELEEDGYPFATGSDSETILHVYDRHGVDGLSRLNGMFAFALYSARDRSLVLARDRLGIKPLYYVKLPDRIVFASELKGLLPLLPQVPDISAPALASFLEIGFNSSDESILKGVRRLEPGTAILINDDLDTSVVTYWSPLNVSPRRLTLEEALEEFDSLFDQVLREHMRSDVPYGLFLSGGLDSGSLLARLSDFHDRPIRTFSVGYTGLEDSDELVQARRVATLFRSEHTELRLHPWRALWALPLSVWSADDLMYDAASLPTLLLAQRAAAELKVVFTGEGGDETFAGYGRYRRSRLQQLLKDAPGWLGGGYRPRSRWSRPMRERAFGSALLAARRTGGEPIRQAWQAAPDTCSYVQKAQLTDIKTALEDDLLVKVDRMLMAFALEGRVPYLDHRIVEFGLSLPDPLKVRGRIGKVLLRRWATRWLPREQLEGKKRGFSVPLGGLLRGGLLEGLGDRLRESRIIKEWFRPGTVSDLVGIQRKTGRATRQLLQLVQFATWHGMFFEGATNRPSAEENPLEWIR
jgi:asparagine synthase (glutamine-hydrolysing)